MEFDDLVDLSLNIEILDKNVYTLLEKLIDLTLRSVAQRVLCKFRMTCLVSNFATDKWPPIPKDLR